MHIRNVVRSMCIGPPSTNSVMVCVRVNCAREQTKTTARVKSVDIILSCLEICLLLAMNEIVKCQLDKNFL